MRLKINEAKTKYTVATGDEDYNLDVSRNVVCYHFERVQSFVYLVNEPNHVTVGRAREAWSKVLWKAKAHTGL